MTEEREALLAKLAEIDKLQSNLDREQAKAILDKVVEELHPLGIYPEHVLSSGLETIRAQTYRMPWDSPLCRFTHYVVRGPTGLASEFVGNFSSKRFPTFEAMLAALHKQNSGCLERAKRDHEYLTGIREKMLQHQQGE